MRLSHPGGIEGENIACDYLQKLHWKIIARNWHCKFGEIDIIAKKSQLLTFFEVKFRRQQSFGGAKQSISSQKLTRLRKSIEWYLILHPVNNEIRVDAILIDQNDQGNNIQHITNILES